MFNLDGKYGSYEGQMKFNEPEGKGTFTFDNGVIYDGQFQSGDFVHGKAIYPSEFVYAAGKKIRLLIRAVLSMKVTSRRMTFFVRRER